MKAGDTAAACAKFSESQRLDPAPGTLANLADCEEQAGRTASAWVLWRRVVDETPNQDPRQVTARKRADALEKRLARLTIRPTDNAPANLVVKRDDVMLGAASLGVPLPIDPGVHVVITSAPGHQDAQFVIESREGEEKTLEVSAGAPLPSLPVTPPIVDVVNEPTRPQPATGRARRWTGYALTTAGIAAAGTGAFFALRARQARNDAATSCSRGTTPPVCWSSAEPALRNDRRNSGLADLGFATGAVASAVGIYLIFSKGGGSEKANAPAQRGLAFGAGPRAGGAEVQIAATF
ncbi:MAG TPA: hypothetical protein VGG33_25470 [Polyangia bacterium]